MLTIAYTRYVLELPNCRSAPCGRWKISLSKMVQPASCQVATAPLCIQDSAWTDPPAQSLILAPRKKDLQRRKVIDKGKKKKDKKDGDDADEEPDKKKGKKQAKADAVRKSISVSMTDRAGEEEGA